MVYDHDCSTVVVLNNPPGPRKVARSNTSFVKFWPDQDYATYGPVFSVQTVDKLVQPDFSVWQLRLGKKEIAPHRYCKLYPNCVHFDEIFVPKIKYIFLFFFSIQKISSRRRTKNFVAQSRRSKKQ